jgi:hypothetical protein
MVKLAQDANKQHLNATQAGKDIYLAASNKFADPSVILKQLKFVPLVPNLEVWKRHIGSCLKKSQHQYTKQ